MLGHSEGKPYPVKIIFPPLIDPTELVVDKVVEIYKLNELVSPTGSKRHFTE